MMPPNAGVVSSMPVMTMAPMMMAPMGMVAAAPAVAAPGYAPMNAQAAYAQPAQATPQQQVQSAPKESDKLVELFRAMAEASKSAFPAAAPSRSPDSTLESRVSKLEDDVCALQDAVNKHSQAILQLQKKCASD